MLPVSEWLSRLRIQVHHGRILLRLVPTLPWVNGTREVVLVASATRPYFRRLRVYRGSGGFRPRPAQLHAA
jgi:hypothetical protein